MKNKFETTDDLLCYCYGDEIKKLPLYRRATKKACVFFTICGALLLIFAFCSNEAICKILTLPLATSGLWLLFKMHKEHTALRQYWKFESILYNKIDPVTNPSVYRKFKLARQTEKKFDIAALWAIECDECHINGDCPLCGAE